MADTEKTVIDVLNKLKYPIDLDGVTIPQALSDIRTLVLAEVKKIKEQGNDCLTSHDIFNEITQALTKLFEEEDEIKKYMVRKGFMLKEDS